MNDRRNDALLIIGIVVLLFGLGALANTLGIVPGVVWQAFRLASRAIGPLALIVLGVIVILTASRGGLRPSFPQAGMRLYRSRRDKMVAGVAGGLAAYFSIDPLLVRLVFVLVGLASFGTAALAYIILAILMPEEPAEEVTPNA